MKTKITLITLMATALLFSSCNTKLEEEVKRLKEENHFLRLGKQKDREEALKFLALSSDTISPALATMYTNAHRKSRTFRLPYCWEFENHHLSKLIAMAEYSPIRFYCALRPDTSTQTVPTDSILTLIAVAVDKNNNDIIINPLSGAANRSALFDFAKPCPPKCGVANPVLRPDQCDDNYCADCIVSVVARGAYPD